MLPAGKPQEVIAAVETSLNYVVDTGEKPVSASHYPAGGARVSTHTGRYERRPVTINNGRLARGGFSLEREGFVFITHETQVANFYDEEEVRQVYYPEMERLVKATTGASRVVVFDHTLRAA